jgi:hypothetical protein
VSVGEVWLLLLLSGAGAGAWVALFNWPWPAPPWGFADWARLTTGVMLAAAASVITAAWIYRTDELRAGGWR